MHSSSFHAHHSPLGAYASFTLGHERAGGGLSISGMKPPEQELHIGWSDGETMYELPFSPASELNLDNFAEAEENLQHVSRVGRKDLANVRREYKAGTDSWLSDNFRFTIATPVWDLPDPDVAGDGELLDRLLPVVCCELELDNTAGVKDLDVVFAIKPGSQCAILEPSPSGIAGAQWDRQFAVAACADDGVEHWVHWDELEYLAERRNHLLGGLAGVSRRVPQGEKRVLKVVLGFYRSGIVTSGLETSYYYTRRYASLTHVVQEGARQFDERLARAYEMDAELEASGTDEHQQFLIAHAQRSYWGNSQLLASSGRPLWMIYEGEYAMMNTFDLSIDQCFYELRRMPWVIRNICDQFVDRYSYHDQLARPADDAAERSKRITMCRDPNLLHDLVPEPVETGLPGGISFCHDMGVCEDFTPPSYSSYELSRLAGCFSYMTCEQLYNWILMATTYVEATDDQDWLRQRSEIVAACLTSLLNRDDPVPSYRNGLNGLDSSRCDGGWEITTYDSLDHSLGQARNNLYMAVKGWASAVGLELLFGRLGELKHQVHAADAAQRAAAAVVKYYDEEQGFIPAVFEGGNTSAIIPAIEGLVYPLVWGQTKALDDNGPYGAMKHVLAKHLAHILQPNVCLFEDGGWKLSSTADNSWCSKIFIAQHVAERVFAIVPEAASHSAHAHWQQIGSAGWAMCDQCVRGEGRGSRYYPRCVTNDLWLWQ